MKKPAFFAIILFINCIPLGGKSNYNECSSEKKLQEDELIRVNNNDRPRGEVESLLTRFIYTF